MNREIAGGGWKVWLFGMFGRGIWQEHDRNVPGNGRDGARPSQARVVQGGLGGAGGEGYLARAERRGATLSRCSQVKRSKWGSEGLRPKWPYWSVRE